MSATTVRRVLEDLLDREAMEELHGKSYTDEEWAVVLKLDAIAEQLAQHCCREINRQTASIPREPIRYNAQWTLEQLIQKLQERV